MFCIAKCQINASGGPLTIFLVSSSGLGRRAKGEGKQLGHPRIAPELEARILTALKASGRTEGVREIAKRLAVDPGTVQRIRPPTRLDL